MKKQSKPTPPRPLLIVIEKLEKKVSGASVPLTTCSSTGYCAAG